MFFHFPFFNGKYLYYQEYFVLSLFLRGLITAIVFLIIAKCFLGDKMRFSRRKVTIQAKNHPKNKTYQERLIEM